MKDRQKDNRLVRFDAWLQLRAVSLTISWFSRSIALSDQIGVWGYGLLLYV